MIAAEFGPAAQIALQGIKPRDQSRNSKYAYNKGLIIMISCITFFIINMITLIIIPLIPLYWFHDTVNQSIIATILQRLQSDNYCVYLFPASIPLSVLVVTLHWLGSRLFRHN